MNITIKDITKIYGKIKSLARASMGRGDYMETLSLVETAAQIAYNFNWIYADEELESMLSDISRQVIQSPKNYTPIRGRMVFYDAFAWDNRGLTQQYIRAMMSWDVELLFVLEGNDLRQSSGIVEELRKYPKAELFTIDTKLPKVEQIRVLYDKISNFAPEKAFLHIKPESVVAVVLWNALSQTTRYQINLTDHAFWLGVKCIDYSLEFRNYGYTVSLEKRGLRADQLLLQPYYPITDCEPFAGFPDEVTSENIVIFTGGSYYKMYGENDIFFTIMSSLLELDPRVIIIVAGSGNVRPLKEYIYQNNLEKKILLIGSRRDINHVFANCDIYLSTYPLTGGLMGQFAAINAKPILSYTSPSIACNFTEGFLNWGDCSSWHVTHTEKDRLLQEAKELISDTAYRKKRGEEAKTHVATSTEFATHLKRLIAANANCSPAIVECIDYHRFTESYLEIENKYLSSFKMMIVTKFRLRLFVLFPMMAFKTITSRPVIQLIKDKLLCSKK